MNWNWIEKQFQSVLVFKTFEKPIALKTPPDIMINQKYLP